LKHHGSLCASCAARRVPGLQPVLQAGTEAGFGHRSYDDLTDDGRVSIA